MGKKIKKKARNTHKERRDSSGSHRTTPVHPNPPAEIVGDGAFVRKERKPCTHIDKGVDLNKISSKVGSTEPVRCEDCREGALDRRASKGRSKHGKKKGAGTMDTKSESKSVWICLECGHFACGGVGLPTTPQSHALRHAKHTRHPCVVQFNNPHLCWCVPCNSLIPVEKSEENGEQKDILSDAVKLIKGRPSVGASINVEDVWFGSSNVGDEIKLETAESRVLDGRGDYVVRGLANLGNTCFFNSAIQNLLVMNPLRDYFMKLDQSVGPLTMALKKLFNETSLEADSRNGINPRNLFGCICAKAPQFKGYQQQDSHELLRYLLDGLCNEELGARKLLRSSGEERITSNLGPTFVDAIFGGQLSSTVCCVECGHSSVVYEPFLDLSLPVPTKKLPPKKAQPVSRPRKAKLPLKKDVKKGAKIQVRGKSNVAPVLAQCAAGPSENKESSCLAPPGVPVKKETVASLDDFSWLDYIEPDAISDGLGSVSQNNDISIIQGFENKQVSHGDKMAQNSSESQSQICSSSREQKLDLDSSRGNSCEDEIPLQVQGSEIILLPYKEEYSTTKEIVSKEGEASSSFMSCEQDTLDFDGFGDLFNEPETVSVSNTESWLGDKNFQENEVTETSFLAGNSSESDPGEVDNTDAPVSIDGCLVIFTQPELLANEHAWHCESCSKISRGRQVETGESQPISTPETQKNEGQLRSQNAQLDLDENFTISTELRNLDNGNLESDIGSTNTAECVVSHTERLDDSNPNDTKCEISSMDKETDSEIVYAMSNCQAHFPEASQRDKDLVESNHTLQELSSTSGCYKSNSQTSFGDQASDSCSANERKSIGCNVDQVQHRDSQLSATARVRESDDSEEEEVDSKRVKVKRNATKRILINRAPPILTIHLKRFSQDARGRLSKLSGHVSFRDSIDLRPYMDPRSGERNKYDYRLVGVVEHSGTMRGGHYVAYVRGEKSRGKTEKEGGSSTWFYASDAHVREVSLEEVLRCEAYILFYEKI